VHGQSLLAQPVDEGRAVGGVEDVVDGVARMRPAHAMRGSEQVQVVVAEQAGGRVAQADQAAQGGQRRWAAVDQVAQQPEAVARGREVEALQQPLQGIAAALQVTDEVVHGARLSGRAGRGTGARDRTMGGVTRIC